MNIKKGILRASRQITDENVVFTILTLVGDGTFTEEGLQKILGNATQEATGMFDSFVFKGGERFNMRLHQVWLYLFYNGLLVLEGSFEQRRYRFVSYPEIAQKFDAGLFSPDQMQWLRKAAYDLKKSDL